MTAPPPFLTTAPAALEVADLARSFGHVRALRGISFRLAAGDALAIFGPNGAGKSTLLRIVAGLLRADRGAVRVHGRELARGDGAQRRRFGLISHASLCYDGLSAIENLEFFGRLYGLPDPRAAGMAALERVGLSDRATTTAMTMSRGMLQRLAIARALLHDPEIVLLDEPFTGLDQRAAASLREELSRLREGRRTLVLVTHNIEEGLEIATHVAVQDRGRFTECGPRAGDAAHYRDVYAAATS